MRVCQVHVTVWVVGLARTFEFVLHFVRSDTVSVLLSQQRFDINHRTGWGNNIN